MAYGLLDPRLLGAPQRMQFGSAMPQPVAAPAGGLGAALPQQGGGLGGLLGGFMDRMRSMRETNPEALMMIGAGMQQGNMGGGFEAAARTMGPAREREEKLKQRNATREWLLSQGLSESDAEAAMADPTIMNHIFKQRGMADSDETFFGNPLFVEDENGNVVPMQMGNKGTTKQVDLGGRKLASPTKTVDVGTEVVTYDRFGNELYRTPKDNYGEAFAKGQGGAEGKARGEASATLGADLLTAEQTVREIDQLLSNEGVDSIVGPMDQFRPGWTMGEKGRDALARYKQLQGRAFLQAYSMLKGGGQITEIEGIKAEQAMARLDRAQSEADFKAALKDLRDAVEAGVIKLKQRAGQVGAPAGGPEDPLGIR